ncbi:MAG: plastocyanin/azurin family copper-binding protein [Thermoproteota archaeon]|nr:plastocyanin/azurin family copper-binding protein [Thermoproteota archaeon]
MDGDIIVWNNDDSSPHTVTERNRSTRSGNRSDDEFDSGIMQSGQTFSYTFDGSGTFEYYCAVHPSMVAEIVVS